MLYPLSYEGLLTLQPAISDRWAALKLYPGLSWPSSGGVLVTAVADAVRGRHSRPGVETR